MPWNDAEAALFSGPLAECVYASRLIGSDPALVLHGGGNTSVKASWTDVTGEETEAIYIKGSGWNLGTIEAAGFAPLPLARVRKLLSLASLSDINMMRELSAARLDAGAPQPSVETMLHAFLPQRVVLHSHADVIVALTNLAEGAERVREVLGDQVVIVPYVMPGFDLAKAVQRIWPEQATEATVGMVLLNHGLFTFADDAAEAYRCHVGLIERAGDYVSSMTGPKREDVAPLPPVSPVDLASIRRAISESAGRPMVMRRHTDEVTASFVDRADLEEAAGQGPLTPDHVIRTKRLPMIGRDVAGYVDAYRHYFEQNRSRARGETTPLDPAPRVVLDRELGMLCAGPTPADAEIAADIYHHTMPVIAVAQDHLGGYQALSPGDLFEVEYWDLEQAKLHRGGSVPELSGEVALVTGAASGIGRACAAELMKKGAAVIGLDLSAGVLETFTGVDYLGIEADVTEHAAIDRAIGEGVERFGGIDVAVMAAGIFGQSQTIASLDADEWRGVMAVNLDSAAYLMSRLHPLLSLSPKGGRVVVVGSKNVGAPGPGAAAYSASKAALTQLARAALEWAADRIRVNLVHPDAVFDTGLWTPELLSERAARYGMKIEDYKRRNLLGVEVTSATVARVVVSLCTDAYTATTGAQIPIDGGNERVI
jgi:rhamnose utilization protein RhaD (predicted bifunctional aldolase and dehydrogenase)/NAD(P)-dependent dehydrogenase (short-subunit alcohol dehydrogenase family)